MRLIDADEFPPITPLAGGVSSLIARADTRRGPVCVKQALPELKVATHWSAPLERSHAELDWMRQVGEWLPGAVPAILGEDRGSHAFAMSWLEPALHPVWKLQLRDGVVRPDFAAGVARRLATIHAAGADDELLAQTFANDENFFQLRLDPYFGAAARVHADCAPMLQQLIADTVSRHDVQRGMLTLHADRGAAMRSKPVAALLVELDIAKSHSRPHVSDDNPYSESQFKTMKYRPDFPARFGCIEDARLHCQAFFSWYNTEHRHSGIGYMTPQAVHYGQAPALRDARQVALDAAFLATPKRFKGRRPKPHALPTAAWINPPPSEANVQRTTQHCAVNL